MFDLIYALILIGLRLSNLYNCTVLFHYMVVGIKVRSGLMFLVICNLIIKNISYLILSLIVSIQIVHAWHLHVCSFTLFIESDQQTRSSSLLNNTQLDSQVKVKYIVVNFCKIGKQGLQLICSLNVLFPNIE